MDLHDRRVAVIGLARSGMAAAELVLRKGGRVRISERDASKEKALAFESWPYKDRVKIEWGEHSRDFISESDLVVLSPGVRSDSAVVKWAREKSIAVIGEVELAWNFCPRPVIAVTGSNGKTTVSMLIKDVLTKSGHDVCLCGNIGDPFCRYVPDLSSDGFVVLEVSSFQLETILEFRPYISVFLNFSQNHLDRHSNEGEYFNAKKRIFMNQTAEDFAVLNYSDARIRSLSKEIQPKVFFFNEASSDQKFANPNYLAVLKIAEILGISHDLCKDVFTEFRGVEHRLELVRSVHGVDFINDSKSTTAQSGRWALENLSGPVIMICGGRDKNIDFSTLKDLVSLKVKTMLVFGESARKLLRTFKDVIPVKVCTDLKDAVLQAGCISKAGDCVVLSPMCASFDMYKDYEERGRDFKNIVNGL